MNISDLANQWPALALLLGFNVFLLKLVQSLYVEQNREIRAQRDAWQIVAENALQAAREGLHQAERSAGQPQSPSLPSKLP